MHINLQYDTYIDKAYIRCDSFCGKFYGEFGFFHGMQQDRVLGFETSTEFATRVPDTHYPTGTRVLLTVNLVSD